MRFFEKLQVIERVDALIKRKGTGSARELGNRLGLSKTAVYEIIGVMRTMGAEIEYCTHRRTYYYTEEKVLAVGFVDKSKINGGKSSLSVFCGQVDLKFELSSARSGFL